MVHHTLLKCSWFNELTEEMGAGKLETDLIKLLGTPAMATKVSKLLLATGDLLQLRHLNEAEASDADDVEFDREVWVEVDW